MATTRADLLDRINSLCASEPFGFIQSGSPFDFDSQPTGQIDQAFRVTAAGNVTLGGFRFSEERTDQFTVWIARKQNANPPAMYQLLVDDLEALTAAIVRDGATGGGDYHVPDGAAATLEHENGREFAVARLTLPINYEAQL